MKRERGEKRKTTKRSRGRRDVLQERLQAAKKPLRTSLCHRVHVSLPVHFSHLQEPGWLAGWLANRLARRQINTSAHESCSPHTPKTIAGGPCAACPRLLSSQSAHTQLAFFCPLKESGMFFRAVQRERKREREKNSNWLVVQHVEGSPRDGKVPPACTGGGIKEGVAHVGH